MENNVYLDSNLADNYDAILNLPIVRIIREQESRVLKKIFDKNLKRNDEVLEIGAGTGFYTLDIAGRVKKVVALEQSRMSHVLEEKILTRQIPNIQIIKSDLEKISGKFDHVMTIGVLDYIVDFEKFLHQCLMLTGKTLIFTAPNLAFVGRCYALISKFGRVKISLYDRNLLVKFFSGKDMNIQDVGLKSSFTSGMTLVCVVRL
jgi:cyclopropane fatty-acyl-phospholipid synthase-like methyltransferase